MTCTSSCTVTDNRGNTRLVSGNALRGYEVLFQVSAFGANVLAGLIFGTNPFIQHYGTELLTLGLLSLAAALTAILVISQTFLLNTSIHLAKSVSWIAAFLVATGISAGAAPAILALIPATLLNITVLLPLLLATLAFHLVVTLRDPTHPRNAWRNPESNMTDTDPQHLT